MVPLEEIAAAGPLVCSQFVRALVSDVELDRLTGGGAPTGREQSAPARRLATIAGAESAVAHVQAVEALRGVLWEAVLEHLRWPTSEPAAARRLGELSDRLAHVCSCALSAGLGAESSPVVAEEPGERETPAVSASEVAPPEREPLGRMDAVIVDERDEHRVGTGASPAPEAQPPRQGAARAPSEARPSWSEERPLSWDESPPVPPMARGAEIEIRDERHEEGPAAWIGSIGRQLERHREDGTPFVVLLVEPLELDDLRRSLPPGALDDLVGLLQEALVAQWPGSVTSQRQGRYWLLADDAERIGARGLSERLQQALAATVRHGGTPLQLAVGVASCPDDGVQAAALAAHADVDLYAARSAARAAPARTREPVDRSI
jgi:GGDEF domain-containing protein